MNPLLGVFYHWLGGLASGSFYVPFRGVKKWSWEVYWLAAGVFSWIFAPWIAAILLTRDLIPVLQEAVSHEPTAVGLGFLFGMMWGAGGLTFGLTMRYLGMSLGMAIALGYCTVFGTIMPPLFKGEFVEKILSNDSGIVTLLGLGVCVLGIIIAAIAGMSKEREMSEKAKKAAIKEFSFVKGLLVATFSGIMSAGMSYGMGALQPMADISILHGTDDLWSQLPRLCVILAGGFTTNFLWCLFLFLKNGTGFQFFATRMTDDGKIVKGGPEIETAIDAPGEEMAKAIHNAQTDDVKTNSIASLRVPMIANYIFCAMAGVTWYLQFFFYSMGETKMGIYQFSSWPLHMASIMIFSSLWGLALKEWKGSSAFTKSILFVTLLTLIFSTIIMGYGTNIGKVETERKFAQGSNIIQLKRDVILAMERQDAGEIAGIPAPLSTHVHGIVAEARKIARFEKDERNGRIRIKGLLDDLKLVDQLSLNREDMEEAKKHASSAPPTEEKTRRAKITALASTVARMADEIPEAATAQDVAAKVTTLADAVAELTEILKPSCAGQKNPAPTTQEK
ncbi:MAG: L-rhamnose/proton symporter RhaT [Planctomycetaceae bacterium]|nr:L-rhamnose/proton symporter RhaT [Planctomycetaceae bacterium]